MAEPRRPPNPLDILHDRRALVDTGLGPIAFVTANAIFGLDTAAILALAISGVIALYRAIRRHPLTNAVGGILGTGLAVFIAVRTGSASGYFVPRALQNAGLALAFTISVLVKRPLVGLIAAPLYHIAGGWHEQRTVRRPFAEASLAWAGLFGLRATVYAVLIAMGQEEALAGAVVVLGWPAFLGTLWFTYRYVPFRFAQLGVDPRPPEHRSTPLGRRPSRGDTHT
jgi:uncharacterized protein DUF3159